MKKYKNKIFITTIFILWSTVQYFVIRTINSYDNNITEIKQSYKKLDDKLNEKLDENSKETNKKLDRILTKMGEHSTSIEVINTKLSFFEEDMKMIYKIYNEAKNEKRHFQR